MIVLTETATTKVSELLEAEDQPELSLRVAVRPGGCSGLSYEMFFDSEKAPDDIEQIYGEGVRVVVDPAERRVPRRRVARLQGRPPGRRVHDQQPERAAHLRLRPVVLLSVSAPSDGPAPAGPLRVRFRCNGVDAEVEAAERRVAAVACCASGSGSSRSRTAARRRASADAARCSSTASRGSRASRRRSRVEGRSVTTVEGLDARRARRGSRRRSSRPADRSAASARPGIVMRASRRARPRSRPCARRAPLPVHRLAHVYDAIARPTLAVDAERDLDAAARRAELEGGVAADRRRRRSARRRAVRRRHRAPRRARRGAAPAGLDAPTPSKPPGCSGSSAASLLEARAAAGKVQGRRTTAEERPPLFDRLPAVPAGRRAARDVVGRARVPRARRVVVRAGRRARVAARERRRVRRQARARRAPRAARELADRLGRRRARRVLARRRRAPRVRSARRSRRPRFGATGVVEIDGVVARGGAARSHASGRRRTRARSSPRWSEVDVAGPPVGTDRARPGSPSRRCSSRARSTPRASIARRSPTIRRCSTSACGVPSGASAGARVHIDATGAHRARRGAGRGRRSARRDRAALLRDRRGAHGARLGAAPRRSPSIPQPARCTTSRSARSASCAPRTCRRSTSRSSTTSASRSRGSSDAVFAAVAAATWNALTRAEGTRPDTFPARQTRAARRLRR